MNELLIAGIELMITGMGIVFAFLAMLIVAVNVMSSVIQRYFPVQQVVRSVSPDFTATKDPGVIAAITAAVTQYRNKHQ